MHSYLRSIGFSELERKELDQILKEVITQYDEKTVIENSEGHLFVEVSKIFGCDVGITVCGEYDENNEFEMEYYFPFFRGTGITTQENVLIERHVGKESYAGAVDDIRIGVTIIFYLQNAAEYLTEHRHGHYTKGVYPVTLAGLAREARILLPVKKDEKQQREERGREDRAERKRQRGSDGEGRQRGIAEKYVGEDGKESRRRGRQRGRQRGIAEKYGGESRRRGTVERTTERDGGEGGEDVYDGTGAGNGAPYPLRSITSSI